METAAEIVETLTPAARMLGGELAARLGVTAAAAAPQAADSASRDDAEYKELCGALGHDPAYYQQQLKKMGYQVTSVNDRDKGHVEYEVVKGDNSYEVQIDLEGGKAKKLDVASNVWQSDATERALAKRH